MSTVSDILNIIITAEDQASGALRNVGGAISSIADGAGAVTAPLADVATSIIGLETAAAGAGIAVAAFSINAADAFQTAFAEITTLIDAPVESLQGFRQEILTYAATSSASLEQVTAATYNAISQGVAYTDSLEAVRVAEQLAVAGKADLNDTLQALVGTMNAYGVGMDEAESFSDTFFTTVKLGKTTIPELASSISAVTGTATLGGVSFDELGAAIATVTSAGAPTSEAITRINAAMGAIISPSKQAAELAGELGIQFDAQALKSNGLEGVLKDVATATGGSAEQMATLFGSTEALNAVNVLAITNADRFGAALEGMRDKSGATTEAFGRMASQTDTLGQAFQVAAVSFGTPMLETFNGVEDALAALFVSLGSASNAGAFEPLQAAINDLLSRLTGLFESIATNFQAALAGVDFGGLIESLYGLAGSSGGLFSDLFGEVDLTTVEGLRAAIQTTVDVITSLTTVTKGIVEGLRPFAQGFAEVADSIGETSGETEEWIGGILGMATGINALLPAVSSLGLGLQAIAGVQLARLFTDIATSSGGAAGGLANAAKSAGALGLAVGGVTFGVVENVKAWDEYIAPLKLADAATANLGETQHAAAILLTELNDALGTNYQSMDEFNAAVDAGELVWDAANRRWTQAQTAMDGLTESIQTLSGEQQVQAATITDWADGWGRLGTQAGDIAGEFARVGEQTRTLSLESRGYLTVTETLADGTQVLAYQTEKSAEALDKAKDKTKDAAKESEDYRLKIKALDQEMQQAKLEAFVSIRTAELEADAERVKATFASIDNTITSSSDLLGSLFGSYTQTEDRFKEIEIESQIKEESKIRRETLDMQKQLARAEIERIQAQTEAMNRGDGIITISADGLEPEIEAFMWKILQNIRVRANAEFQDYLLGMGAT